MLRTCWILQRPLRRHTPKNTKCKSQRFAYSQPHLQWSDRNPIGTKASSFFSPCFAYFSTHQLNFMGVPKPFSSCTEKNHFHSSPPITPSQMPSNPANRSRLPGVELREPKAANGSGEPYWGPSDAKKDFVFCSSRSLERVASLAGLLCLQHSGGCILPSLWERCDGGGGISPRPHSHEESQQWSSGEASGRGSHSLRSAVHHKSSPYFPSAKVCWLHCLAIPEPVFFAAYLKLGNPQELQAGKQLVKSLQPSGFFTRDFSFSRCFVFKPSAVCLQWEFAGIKTGEKLLEFTRGTKGLLCRRIWRTRLLSLPPPSFLFSPSPKAPASGAGGGGLLPGHRATGGQGDGSRAGG